MAAMTREQAIAARQAAYSGPSSPRSEIAFDRPADWDAAEGERRMRAAAAAEGVEIEVVHRPDGRVVAVSALAGTDVLRRIRDAATQA